MYIINENLRNSLFIRSDILIFYVIIKERYSKQASFCDGLFYEDSHFWLLTCLEFASRYPSQLQYMTSQSSFSNH